jgi:hypothetical protein
MRTHHQLKIFNNKPEPLKNSTRGRNKTKGQSLKKILLTEIHTEPREEFQNPIQESAQIKNKRKCTIQYPNIRNSMDCLLSQCTQDIHVMIK